MSDTVIVGDHLDTGIVYLLGDNNVHSFMTIGNITLGRKVVLFGGPAPFSKLDTKQALEYAELSKEIMQYVDMVYGVYVQDAFVCKEFQNKIRKETDTEIVVVLADGDAFFARNYQLTYDFTNQGLGVRSRRWAAVVDDGVIEYIGLDEPGQIDETSAKRVLEYLKTSK